MKFCKDCKFFTPKRILDSRPKCGHPDYLDLVTGKAYWSCETMRRGVSCGPTGILWEKAKS